jgi:3-oxoacyl-[acyl-carrier protein] reductase
MNKLKNKVAIVTGASKGIGASIAKYFAAEGANVVVNYASSKEGADKVVKAITENGGRAISVQGDVSKEADVLRLFAETEKAFGTLDILVNNAGIYNYQPIEQVSTATIQQQLNINITGAVLSIREAIKLFGEKGGNIINISSEAGKTPLPTGSVYSATKAALDAVTVSLSKEFAGRNIRINSILPGVVEFADKFLSSGRPLHLLINNVGIMFVPLRRDSRGIESQLVTNYLAPFQLTARLWKALKKANGTRVINVSSQGHQFAPFNFEDPNFKNRAYETLAAYGQSKTAVNLFSLELNTRAKSSGVSVYALHPGNIWGTELLREAPLETL